MLLGQYSEASIKNRVDFVVSTVFNEYDCDPKSPLTLNDNEVTCIDLPYYFYALKVIFFK